MSTQQIQSLLQEELPVLFLNIGWADSYTGQERIQGAHAWLRAHPKNNSEFTAFKRTDSGYLCGAGYGRLPARFHVVVVSKEPYVSGLKVVGLYAAASPYNQPNPANNHYAWLKSEHALCIASGLRPLLKHWPRGKGMRRWARSSESPSHLRLLKEFSSLIGSLAQYTESEDPGLGPDSQFEELFGLEGVATTSSQTRRKRLRKLREEKIKMAKLSNKGRLSCEVPGCGFDFFQIYGELGQDFIHVHHKVLLSDAPTSGRNVNLDDLALVCPNCHAMIHRYGECRSLDLLIPHKQSKSRKAA